MELNDLALWGTFLSGLGALAALVISLTQIKKDANFNEANFWLTLRELFHQQDRRCVHNDFREGRWQTIKPTEIDDWIKIEDYLGLFEICERMLERKIINEKMFRSLYEYRVYNFLKNSEVAKCKLIYEHYDWTYLYKLLNRLYGDHWEEMRRFLTSLEIDYNEIDSESQLLAKLKKSEKEKFKKLREKTKI